VKEHGTIFQPWGVQCIKAGIKTQTRRLVSPSTMLIDGRKYTSRSKYKGTLFNWDDFDWEKAVVRYCKTAYTPSKNLYVIHKDLRTLGPYLHVIHRNLCMAQSFCPEYQVGDHIWVRETHSKYKMPRDPAQAKKENQNLYAGIRFKADGDKPWGNWRPSIFMLREDSRIILKITDVRIERVQAITDEDAMAEGCNPELPIITRHFVHPRDNYAQIWDDINAKNGNSWKKNPWVIALDFRILKITAGWNFC